VTLLVIFWSIPVAFVGAISNVQSLINIIPAFSFLNKLPSQVFGVVSGLLPVILLAVLMALLPIILRLVAKFAGDPTLSVVELSVQNYYFAFQVVQVFLVATIGSAASASISTIIKDPTSAASLLAKNIPKANNFYLSYFVLQGLGIAGSGLAMIVGLAIFFILGKLLDKTARKKYKRWMTLASPGFGTMSVPYPVSTAVIRIRLTFASVYRSIPICSLSRFAMP